MRPRPELCVGAVVIDDDRLLLIQRGAEPERGRWSLPGGRVESGEALQEAVVREVREETGLEVACGPMLGWVERISDDHHFVILDFTATTIVAGTPVAGDDATAVAWVPRHELADWDLVSGLLEFLGDQGLVDTIV